MDSDSQVWTKAMGSAWGQVRSEREAPPFLGLPLPFCRRLTPSLVVLQLAEATGFFPQFITVSALRFFRRALAAPSLARCALRWGGHVFRWRTCVSMADTCFGGWHVFRWLTRVSMADMWFGCRHVFWAGRAGLDGRPSQ